MRLAEIGEFGLIDRIAARTGKPGHIRIGIGDDAAGIVPTPGYLTLVTTDMLLEGVHFDLTWHEPLLLGRKALAVNLSDLAAMGAEPRWFLLSLASPPELPVEFLDQLVTGMLERATEFGVALAGGDTCASQGGLTISITLGGEQLPERTVRRHGARPGDLVVVTGELGEAALGLELLRRGERYEQAVSRHLDPTPRAREGVALAAAGLPTAMIDISDGLLADLGHILTESGVGAEIDQAQLPLSGGFAERCAAAGCDPVRLALAGGEDYELLFTIAPDRLALALETLREQGSQGTLIGRVTADRRLTVRRHDGREHPVDRCGFNHFAPSGNRTP